MLGSFIGTDSFVMNALKGKMERLSNVASTLLKWNQISLQLTITEGEVKTSRIDSLFRWWSKCFSVTICRTAGRNFLFSSVRIVNMINVDR